MQICYNVVCYLLLLQVHEAHNYIKAAVSGASKL